MFGVAVFASASISDVKFQHLASVVAQWIDNDEDGCPDTPLALAKVTCHHY